MHALASTTKQGVVVVGCAGARSRFESCRADAPLVLRALADGLLYVGQLGGGYVHGDRYALDVTVRAGATLTMRGQASTKVYPGASSFALRARVEGCLVIENEPVVPYAGSRYEGVTELELGEHGSLCVWDAFTAGRVAAGERWQMASFANALMVRRANRLLLREAVRVREPQGANAFATLVVAGPRFEARLGALAAIARRERQGAVVQRDDVLMARVALTEPGTLEIVRARWLAALR